MSKKQKRNSKKRISKKTRQSSSASSRSSKKRMGKRNYDLGEFKAKWTADEVIDVYGITY